MSLMVLLSLVCCCDVESMSSQKWHNNRPTVAPKAENREKKEAKAVLGYQVLPIRNAGAGAWVFYEVGGLGRTWEPASLG